MNRIFLTFSLVLPFFLIQAKDPEFKEVGTLPKGWKEKPSSLVPSMGIQFGGNNGGAFLVEAKEGKEDPFQDWLKAKKLGSAVFKVHPLGTELIEEKAALLIEQYKKAHSSGVGVELYAASLVKLGEKYYVLTATENFFSKPSVGDTIKKYKDISFDSLFTDTSGLLPSTRMEIALQLYKAHWHLADYNYSNFLAKIIEVSEGSPKPPNTVLIGRNKYLRIAAIDIGEHKPAFQEVDLSKPYEKVPGKNIFEQMSYAAAKYPGQGELAERFLEPTLVHQTIEKFCKKLGVDTAEFLQKASEWQKSQALTEPTNNPIQTLVNSCKKN